MSLKTRSIIPCALVTVVVAISSLFAVPATYAQDASAASQSSSPMAAPGSSSGSSSMISPSSNPLLAPSSNTDAESPALGMSGAGGFGTDASQQGMDSGLSGLGGAVDSTGGGEGQALSAQQIDTILQQNPELIDDVKGLLAEGATQQGIKTDSSSITDQMLYSQIASNPSLRANLTVYLSSRGYVTSDLVGSAPSGSQMSMDGSAGQRSDPGALGATPLGGSTQDSARMQGNFGGGSSQSPFAAGRVGGGSTPDQRTGGHSSTDQPEEVHRTSPYNLRSLRDLYVQIPNRDEKLHRFGADVFLSRQGGAVGQSMGGIRSAPASAVDMPVGPDYVVGPGDGLTISLWGGVTQSVSRVVDREGRILLPEAGSLEVAGLTLERTQDAIAAALAQQFRNAKVSVTIARLRSIRVYVVGDVQRPGAYDLGSLSTPLNALYAAGGPTSVGSLRVLRHYRGEHLISEVDLYDFLLHGVRTDEHLQQGDTLLVPPAGPQIAVWGSVRRPAIYELKAETSLASLLEDAGGTTVAASLGHIVIERIQPNQQRETITVDLPEGSSPDALHKAMDTFLVKDGDRIHVAPILPYSERDVYLEDHVVRPGKYPYRDGMQLCDLLHGYADLLPEPADRGEIIRLMEPNRHPEAVPFNLADVLAGKTQIALQPFDTVRVLGRYETDAPKVSIGGEVLRPGQYPLSANMTASDLVRLAGGFKRSAFSQTADLTSYQISGGEKVVSDRTAIRIGEAVQQANSAADVRLKAGDVLTIHQISGWDDIGSSVVVNGQVNYPGSYGLQDGERLSSVLRRAGGFRASAYPMGAVLVRQQVRELEETSRAEMIRQVETSSQAAELAPNISPASQAATLQLIKAQQQQMLQRLQSQPATGRLVIHVNEDIDSWANTDADVELRRGDVLTIPKRPGFVLVSGSVYNPVALTFTPGKPASWYLKNAGGSNDVANRGEIFIIRVNGSVIGRRSGSWLGGDVLSTRLDPGDVIVVPQRIIGASLFWQNLLGSVQIFSSIALTAAIASGI